MLENLLQYIPINTSDYYLTRFVFLRILGISYLFAYFSLADQVIPLLGKNGLTPAKKYLQAVETRFENKWKAFWNRPTIFLWKCNDQILKYLAWLGVILSFLLTIGFANVFLLLTLWILYMSYVHIGQVWYRYGWESQLLETGFLAIFLVPLFNPLPFSNFATPLPAIIALLWLTARINLGSGLIKLKADKCWKKLTCLNHHFETQPIPNPLSRYFHFLPKTLLKFGTLWTHIVQIGIPFFLVIPGWPRWAAGALLILFQLQLFISGNLSFLNIVTIAPIVAAFNDEILAQILPKFLTTQASQAATNSFSFPWIAWIYLAFVAYLSIPVVKNLFRKRQLMNYSFNQFHLVNTYGAFGSVGKNRKECVVKGTKDELGPDAEWKEYEFKAKPTDVNRTPPFIAPYQPRIDWQIWFAAMQRPRQNPWMFHLIWKLLHNDPLALDLIKENPFPDNPPKYIKVDHYIYEFANLKDDQYWNRKKIGEWAPPMNKESLERQARMEDW